MRFYLIKTLVTPPPEPPRSWPERLREGLEAGLWILFGLLLVPFMLAGLAAYCCWLGLVAGYEKGRRGLGLRVPAAVAAQVKQIDPPQELLRTEQVLLTTVEPDWEANVSPRLTEWLDHRLEFYSDYFGGEIGHLRTEPEIPGLHGQLVGGLCEQGPEGVFLQVFQARPGGPRPAVTTWLVYLEFATLRWHRVAETGDVYLLADENEKGLFKGVSMHGPTVQLQVKAIPETGPTSPTLPT